MEDKALLVRRGEIYIPLSHRRVLEPFASKDEVFVGQAGVNMHPPELLTRPRAVCRRR